MYNPQLETFLCVAEEGSFNKAAEKLYISAPAVIKQMIRYLIQYCKESVARAEKAMESQGEVIRVGISPLTPPQVFASTIGARHQDLHFGNDRKESGSNLKI